MVAVHVLVVNNSVQDHIVLMVGVIAIISLGGPEDFFCKEQVLHTR